MTSIINLANTVNDIFERVRNSFDFSASLLLRIFLAPIFIMAGYGKLQLGVSDVGFFERFTADPNVVAWFGNPDWGLGLPAPEFMAFMAGWTEFLGGWLLLIGLLTRYIAIPLMFTMIVAAVTAHWDYGWHALPESKLTMPWEWRTDIIEEANVRKERAKDILKEHANYGWITEYGSITILKNGIEFAATYFLMLLAVMFMGGGKYVSLDYWLAQKFRQT
ncbi:MAG: DoxX family protein [Proteobacteria bacterium]|nr:DoxX family protein [Pseudomonadota bacterium]